jgi:hypothetical protein
MTTPILALDPSLTRTGWAYFDNDELLRCGWHTPRGSLAGRKTTACQRIDSLITKIADEPISEASEIVIEVTSGHTSNRHGGKGAGLALYGMAVGAFYQWACTRYGHNRVHAIEENRWIRKRSKEERQQHARLLHGKVYTPQIESKDRGGDTSDAIMLGDWWINHGRLYKRAGMTA